MSEMFTAEWWRNTPANHIKASTDQVRAIQSGYLLYTFSMARPFDAMWLVGAFLPPTAVHISDMYVPKIINYRSEEDG